MDFSHLEIQALSIRDFVAVTKDMSLDELIDKGEKFKQQLKELPCCEGEILYPLSAEIDNLIAFVGKVIWRLRGNIYPAGAQDYGKDYLDVVRRYIPYEE